MMGVDDSDGEVCLGVELGVMVQVCCGTKV